MEILTFNALFCILITIISYVAGLAIFRKLKYGWLNPLFTVTIFVIGFLSLFHIDLKHYSDGTQLFSWMLGVATVSLAIPLYQQLKTIKNNLRSVLLGVLLGTSVGLISVLFLSRLLNIKQEIFASLIPKSVTMPIALTVSDRLGGIPSLTVLFVVISGLFSIIAGPYILKFVGIKSKIAKGLALGATAQALGAAKALQWGEKEGAMGSIAMTTSALVMALIAPFLF